MCPKCGKPMNRHFCHGCGYRAPTEERKSGEPRSVIMFDGAIDDDGLLSVDGNKIKAELSRFRGKKVAILVKVL